MAIDYKVLADFLLDSFLDINGYKGSIEYLLGCGFDKDDLLELGFDLEEIEEVLERSNESDDN